MTTNRVFFIARSRENLSLQSREIGMILLKTQEVLELLQESLSEKPNDSVYDWFYLSMANQAITC